MIATSRKPALPARPSDLRGVRFRSVTMRRLRQAPGSIAQRALPSRRDSDPSRWLWLLWAGLVVLLCYPGAARAICNGGPDCAASSGSDGRASSGFDAGGASASDARRKRHPTTPHSRTELLEARWRHALDGYASPMLRARVVPLAVEVRESLATYLGAMHRRIHPVFAEKFLRSLDRLPKDEGWDVIDGDFATVEIAIDDRGQIADMGIVKSSGLRAFDIAILDALERTSPFGPAPRGALSEDGRLYLRWQFFRDPQYACSAGGASPFRLTGFGRLIGGGSASVVGDGARASGARDTRDAGVSVPIRGEEEDGGTANEGSVPPVQSPAVIE